MQLLSHYRTANITLGDCLRTEIYGM